MMPFFYVLALAWGPPLAAVIAYAVRRQRRMAAEEARDVVPAFASADLPAPGFFLRRFNHEERNYLLRHRKALIVAFAMLLWCFTVILCGGLLPSSVADTGYIPTGPQRIWYSYLFAVTIIAATFSVAVPMFAGAVSVMPIGAVTVARFPRTRPLSRRFLFWGGVLPTLGVYLSATILAALLSFLVLRVSYGPVYNHLHDAAAVRAQPKDADCGCDVSADLLATSLPRIFLSQATTGLLGFSLGVTAVMLPFQMQRNPKVGALVMAGAGGYLLFIVFANTMTHAHKYARYLFLYSRMGTPPPYLYALVPILLSTALLLLARKLNDRLET